MSSIAVFLSAHSAVLSRCDGDVRVLLPEKSGERNIVFKPNYFNADSDFYMVFKNPGIHVHCNKTNTTTCVVDSSKGVYYVTVRGARQAGSPTMVRVDLYAEGCGAGTQRTFNIPGTQLSIFS